MFEGRNIMKKLLAISVLISLGMTQNLYARTLIVDVYGMTCPFCVDSLERKFKKMPSISKVEVSMKTKQVRLETEPKLPTIEMIKQMVLDAGFTPLKVEELKS
jgi:copper chaperone CopZ